MIEGNAQTPEVDFGIEALTTGLSQDGFLVHPWMLKNPNDNTFIGSVKRRRKEGNILFNDALNTFYLRLYGVGHMVKDMGYSLRLAARVLLYAPSHREDSTYHSLLHQSWSTSTTTHKTPTLPPPHSRVL